MGIEATEKRAKWTGTWTERFEGGKIVEGMDWGNWDAAGLVQQLGVASERARELLRLPRAIFPVHNRGWRPRKD